MDFLHERSAIKISNSALGVSTEDLQKPNRSIVAVLPLRQINTQDSQLSKTLSTIIFSKNSQRYDKTQESGVGRWLIYHGFLLICHLIAFKSQVNNYAKLLVPLDVSMM
jgi:hypothetical protein